jgi:hypothetical protein
MTALLIGATVGFFFWGAVRATVEALVSPVPMTWTSGKSQKKKRGR